MVAFPSHYLDGESKVRPYGSIDMDGLAKHVIRVLPSYARPLFVRITSAPLEVTGKTQVERQSHMGLTTFLPLSLSF